MAKEGKGYNQSMFTNKDGYLKGGVNVEIPSHILILPQSLFPQASTKIGKVNIARTTSSL